MALGVFVFKGKAGVYKMINSISGNFYIGSSKNISQRVKTHKQQLKLGYKGNIRIKNDLEKYGIDSFRFESLEYCDESIMKDREQYYFELLKPTYNVWKNIYSASGRYYTQEQLESSFPKREIKDKDSFRKKLRESWARRKLDPNYKESIKHLDKTGSKHSEETKRLFSLQRKGKPKSEETRKKMSEARLGWKFIDGQWIKKK